MRSGTEAAIRGPSPHSQGAADSGIVPQDPSGRIWDLRCGDADDNRTSPHGRGWRSLALAAALEFNYASAAVTFLALVLVPAILLGLVPPLVVLYGRRTAGAAALVSSYPVWAAFVLAVLAGVAIRFVRPLLSLAADNTWHLHYTLVFPLFVMVREIMSAGLERLPGQMAAPGELDRRRRIGTAVAALLLAGGSLAVARAISLSTGGGATFLEVPLGTIARAALGNAVVIMAVSTVVSSVYWFWREMSSRRPVRDWSPEAPEIGPAAGRAPARHGIRTAHRSNRVVGQRAPGATVRVAHLSDLHVVGERYGCRMECGTDGPLGNATVGRALRLLSAHHAARPVDLVLVTGDVTDAGTRAEWIEFLDLLRAHPAVRARTLFVPGNHDVNIVDRTNTGRIDLPWSTSHALRKLRFVLALDEVQGDWVHLAGRTTGEIGPTLREYLQQDGRPALLRDLAERGGRHGRRELARVWEAIFPLVAPPDGNGWGVILLDSNARSHFSLTNAVGVVSRPQLQALDALLRGAPGTAWLVALHHHVVEYPIPSVGLQERIGLALVNAPDVLEVIAPHAARVLVMHGHRHRDWIGTGGGVVLCSAPSVSLGAAGADLYRGSFYVHDVTIGAAGQVQLTTAERLPVT